MTNELPKPTDEAPAGQSLAASALFGVWNDPSLIEPYDWDPLLVWARKPGKKGEGIGHSWWQAYWDGLDFFEEGSDHVLVEVTHWMTAPPPPNEKVSDAAH